MNELVTNNILAIGYLILWVATFVWYHFKYQTFDAGSAIIGMYIIYAIFSIFAINDELFSMAFNPLKLAPYIYLYGMMMVALSPIIYSHFHPTNTIEEPHTRIFTFLSWFIFICAILMLPKILSEQTGGLASILTDANAGNEAYSEQVDKVATSGSSIRNLPAVIYNSFSDFPPFLFFYFLSLQKRSKITIVALVVLLIISIYMPISQGLRGGTVTALLTIFGAYMLFRRYLSKNLNKAITRIGIASIIIIAVPIIAITISRFGKEQAGVSGFVNWYVGQGSLYFNNYGLDNGGIRNGDRTMNFFKRFIDKDTPKNFVERRDKDRFLKIDDNFFSTFVGDFTLDFGPIIPIFIFIAFNVLIIVLIRPKSNRLKVYQLLLIYLTVCISLQGGMTLYSYSDLGALRIITLVLVYSYLRYHEVLLKRFPIKKDI
jgi:oligosaccharide repeat unit polymerase